MAAHPPRSPPNDHATDMLPLARPSPLSISSSGPSQPPHARKVSIAVSEPDRSSPGVNGPRGSLGQKGRTLGLQDKLRREVDGVVKRRTGGVLGRGYILKTGQQGLNAMQGTEGLMYDIDDDADHFPTGRAMDLELNIQGAPNFRAPQDETLNVFGVAQPTTAGLKSILTMLGAQPTFLRKPNRRGSTVTGASPALNNRRFSREESPQRQHFARSNSMDEREPQGKAVWFSTREETLVYCNGRPYVLRDASNPYQTLALSERAPNLEDIERRLKIDILDEARKYGGMILTHDEITGGTIIPTWVSVDEESIQTPREVWDDMKKKGWRVDYYRIPIAPDTPIEHNYLDSYVSVLKEADPLTTALVYNCGMGVVRTTFGMCAAMLVRRKQLLLRGYDDPFASETSSGFNTPQAALMPQAAQAKMQTASQQALNKSLLKMTRILNRNLPSKHPSTAIDLLTSQPALLEQLCKAHMGSYQIVLSLLSSLDQGKQMKHLVDAVIDSCDAVINLRENVIEQRIKYSVASMDDKKRQVYLEKALRSLEQYFDLIVFASYVDEEDAGDTGVTFSDFLKSRPEIWHQIKVLRRNGGNRLFAFAPANDLSVISRSSENDDHLPTHREVDLQGGKVLGDEWAEHVVTNRNGIMLRASTLLKSDLWLTESASSNEGVRGAIGFRQIKGSMIYATGQPTQDAVWTILQNVREQWPTMESVVWVCLREEPLVMVNGSPYCLRRGSTALRNMRDYSGVSSTRLEMLEQRLKSDVIAEIDQFQGRVLLHTETADGQVVPVWESVDKQDVTSLRELMDEAAHASKEVQLNFVRIPITSESSPDFHDITEIVELCMRTDLSSTAIILNDQLGRGRSSTTSVIVLLIQRWLKDGRSRIRRTPSRSRTRSSRKNTTVDQSPKTSWQVINSCLRVIRNGLHVKQVVDEAIDATAAQFNLRQAIEDIYVEASEATEPEKKRKLTSIGLHHLKRYYHLLLFAAYLDDRAPEQEEYYSFESFIKHRPVFKTLEKELEEGGIESLAPLEKIDPADGMALPDEVTQVVVNRAGVILSAQTILKSDFFSGLQKQSLPDRVDGAANYRKLSLICDSSLEPDDEQHKKFVYGTGMPSAEGLRNALNRMDAGPNGSRAVKWTSLREEPVLYVNSRPHVLRLVDKPLTNVETTGVTAAVVERMEEAMKKDVINELRAQSDGRLLLHDEVESKPGVYEIIPIWETVKEEDVMTPKELYESVIREGYKVDYMRVAITDEQAPLPVTLQVMVNRITSGLRENTDFVFNCQMGRGRTTTGMAVASLIATIAVDEAPFDHGLHTDDEEEVEEEEDEAVPEATQYQNGEYKTILQLVTVMSRGKEAKRVTDRAIDLMQGVQNLRKAIYDFKLQVDAAEPGSAKYKAQLTRTINYLYRYGALIVLANFLLEMKAEGIPLEKSDFSTWLQKHREIRTILNRSTLD
ncbi:hypothetical protein I350_04372 [Cryptococcus amylolentus CBS 6273]|uniref:Tyrosine specific protein phosphatases domain-containing protein n=1 Tax=Cryptococcus amylolentus CBS 6273 TaxID=1296118 RepID=A0A1E3K1U5_9TREE|nr:hypothetical protein I350_04372 [Cryptococcus amylolentus CBS 6273]